MKYQGFKQKYKSFAQVVKQKYNKGNKEKLLNQKKG